MRYNRQGRKANVGAGTATATEPTREHKQYATQGSTVSTGAVNESTGSHSPANHS